MILVLTHCGYFGGYPRVVYFCYPKLGRVGQMIHSWILKSLFEDLQPRFVCCRQCFKLRLWSRLQSLLWLLQLRSPMRLCYSLIGSNTVLCGYVVARCSHIIAVASRDVVCNNLLKI
ncbi:hypothetical protein Lalb_Chr06g0171651 [Lupinus albus]|uniref:Uncharacterized protein n=1 Tax=Lupinus albus TaxID=3870 RepID=A0A6A4QEQ8_LUPAL|nr:hypothetical protein Lalb_Chr06g0171651 [Lupinus albus]